MKLIEYIEKLQKFAEKYPDKELWMASDPEGNYYREVSPDVSVMYCKKDEEYGTEQMYGQEDFEEIIEEYKEDGIDVNNDFVPVLVLWP
jgi:hypothetical protein